MQRHLFITTLLAFVLALAAPRSVRAQATAYVISDNTTGFVLESVNGQKKVQVGSLTKIATAMVVLDWADATKADLSQLATVPDSVVALSTAAGVGFQPGYRCSLRDLLYASMMQSDNQAAETLADHVGRALGSTTPVHEFVAQMNALARRLGMVRTRFLNAHGIDTLEKSLPYSTADDLAKLTAYAEKNSAFRFYCSQKERKITIASGLGEQSAYLLRNTNDLVGINGIDGVKTGTTNRAGQCLIISAPKPPESRQAGDKVMITPRRLNVVILGSTDRFALGTQLLNKGWSLYDAWAAAGRPMKDWRAPKQ